MKSTSVFSITLFTLIILFPFTNGCRKKDNPAALEYGTVKGVVYLHDADGNALPGAGVKVWIFNTNDTTFTNSSGVWSFDDIHIGGNEYLFSKEGYTGVTTWFDLQQNFIANLRIDMGSVPGYTVSNLAAVTIQNPRSFLFSGDINATDKRTRYVAICFFGFPVDTSMGTLVCYYETTAIVPADSTSFHYTFLADEEFFSSMFYRYGESFYAAAYPLPPGYPFPNFAPGRRSFVIVGNNVPLSNTISVTLPKF